MWVIITSLLDSIVCVCVCVCVRVCVTYNHSASAHDLAE